MKHPEPDLFKARLKDLHDLGFKVEADSLEEADLQDRLIQEVRRLDTLQRTQYNKNLWDILQDLLDDLGG